MHTRIQRRLTATEMSAITAAIGDTTTPDEALWAALYSTFDALLKPLGESLHDFGPHRHMHPQDYAIPTDQWHTIADTLLTTPMTTGTVGRAVLLTEWANYGPSNYEEEPSAAPHTAGNE